MYEASLVQFKIVLFLTLLFSLLFGLHLFSLFLEQDPFYNLLEHSSTDAEIKKVFLVLLMRYSFALMVPFLDEAILGLDISVWTLGPVFTVR
jgi:hypothetical protein